MKYSRETYLIVRYFGELSNNIYSEERVLIVKPRHLVIEQTCTGLRR